MEALIIFLEHVLQKIVVMIIVLILIMTMKIIFIHYIIKLYI